MKMQDATSETTGGAATEEIEEKAARRPMHPLVGHADPNVWPFAELPSDYDPAAHAPLKKKDFKEEASYYDYRASMARRAVTRFETLAAEARAGGSTKDKATEKRLARVAAQMEKLKAAIRAGGGDPDAILAKALASS
jgi:hypothetical protein